MQSREVHGLMQGFKGLRGTDPAYVSKLGAARVESVVQEQEKRERKRSKGGAE